MATAFFPLFFAADPVGQRLARTSVLLVEDDLSTSGALSDLLRYFGCDVTAVPTVHDALDALERGRPQFVLLDLMLPDGHGTDVLSAVRTRRLPAKVIVISATADQDLLARVRSLGPDALLSKPLDFPKLVKAMDLTPRP